MWAISKRSVSSLVMIIMLLTGGLTILNGSILVSAGSITVPDDYPTIQQAVNAASEGDEIFVRAGSYPENVVVDKAVTLLGENRETIISPTQDAQGVTILSSNAQISGFMIRNCPRTGIVIKSNSCLISDNSIIGTGSFGGIFLDGRSTTVEGNIIFNNSIIGNNDDGINFMGANRNYVIANKINGNQFVGIYLFTSSFNVVYGNEISDNWDTGIVLDTNSNSNEIINNNASKNGKLSNPYTIMWGAGIRMALTCYSNTIAGNLIDESLFVGIHMRYYCDHNVFYHNSFIDNPQSVINDPDYPSMNHWDNGYPSGGNYWSDYSGTDLKKGQNQDESGSDGIGDTPYLMDPLNIDHFPLMQPYVKLEGDVDGNGKVDMADVALACTAFGSFIGNSKYSIAADVNLDLRIDLRDLGIVCSDFGNRR